MSKFRVVITGGIQPVAMDLLKPHCEILHWNEREPIPSEWLLDRLKTAEGLFSSGMIKVDEQLLSHAPKLRVISQASVGYDNIDIDACTKRGIPFGNTPGVLVEATADLTFGLLLSAARRIHEGWELVKSGEWYNGKGLPFGIDLFGKTIGIVGMGQIGTAVAKRALACGMRVIYHNRNRRDDDIQLAAQYVSFDHLLNEADCIVVLIPLSSQTRGMFGTEQFSKMKPSAYFINAARGSIVDTQALYEALSNQTIAYAALDVTDPEPLAGDHPLLSLPNILITPHIGSATQETRDRMAKLAVENLLNGLNRRRLAACVNEEVNYPGE